MPVIQDGDTDRLLTSAAAGVQAARDELLARHRARLRRAVARRLDRRLTARIDPSDVVQEALADADRKLAAYLRDRPLPFYPWLRRLAFERVIRLHRRHVRASKRSVTREALMEPEGATAAAGPASAIVRRELQERVRGALGQLSQADQAVLTLRHFEHRSVRETAERLGTSEGAVKVRHLRALRRLSELLIAQEGLTG